MNNDTKVFMVHTEKTAIGDSVTIGGEYKLTLISNREDPVAIGRVLVFQVEKL